MEREWRPGAALPTANSPLNRWRNDSKRMAMGKESVHSRPWLPVTGV